jgi:hypothetical protein
MGGPTYADVAASIGSTMDGSSFSGLLTSTGLRPVQKSDPNLRGGLHGVIPGSCHMKAHGIS